MSQYVSLIDRVIKTPVSSPHDAVKASAKEAGEIFIIPDIEESKK